MQQSYYQNSFTFYDSSWKSINKYKKSSNENKIDHRKQKPNTICYIQPSQQQKRNYLQMRIGPTLINNKVNIFNKKIEDKTLLDVTFNLVIDSKKKRSKTKLSDMITK